MISNSSAGDFKDVDMARRRGKQQCIFLRSMQIHQCSADD